MTSKSIEHFLVSILLEYTVTLDIIDTSVLQMVSVSMTLYFPVSLLLFSVCFAGFLVSNFFFFLNVQLVDHIVHH